VIDRDPRRQPPKCRARSAGLAGCLLALAACARPERPPLFLLVTVDTLRADHLGAYGSELALSPNLDALAGESLVFTRAYSPASFTVPSIAALLTGRYPEELGIWSNESGLPGSTATLASRLRAHGWQTAAVVSNFVLRADAGLATGFDLFDDRLPQLEAVRRLPERVASDTTDAALAALDACTARGRCFLWVHYQDPHGPYTPPAELRERYLARERAAPDGTRLLPVRPDHVGAGGIPNYQALPGQREVAFYRAGYDGEVRFVDEQVGRLLAGVERRGLRRRALIVFAADHGESLGEGDYWFSHGEHLTDVLVRVPLFLYAPGLPPGRRDDVAALVDVLPTLLRRLEGEAPPGPGRDLLADGAGGRASTPYLATLGGSTVPRHGVVAGDHKLVLSEDPGGERVELVRTGSDDADRQEEAPELVASLRSLLETLQRGLERRYAERRRSLSAEDLRKLQALGYVSGADGKATPGPAAPASP